MNYLVILLLTVLAVSVFSSGMETRSKVESGPGMEVKTKVETQKTVTDTHPRVRRWGYYGGMGGVRYGIPAVPYIRLGRTAAGIHVIFVSFHMAAPMAMFSMDLDYQLETDGTEGWSVRQEGSDSGLDLMDITN
uniref:Secreted protein n=1 Tax=Caenorhabditis tropicalis TaxID=1561998 RepID=A0A1I7T6Y9_9PELO